MGLTPGLVRSVFYGGLRLGLYEPSLRLSEMALGSPNILTKVLVGAFSGALATAVTNPVEVLKVVSLVTMMDGWIHLQLNPNHLCVCLFFG